MKAAKAVADRLYREAFETPRDPRSAEYKHGVLAWLRMKTGQIKTVQEADCYTPGTASSDAFSAGVSEGRSIWDRHQRACAKAAGDTL